MPSAKVTKSVKKKAAAAPKKAAAASATKAGRSPSRAAAASAAASPESSRAAEDEGVPAASSPGSSAEGDSPGWDCEEDPGLENQMAVTQARKSKGRKSQSKPGKREEFGWHRRQSLTPSGQTDAESRIRLRRMTTLATSVHSDGSVKFFDRGDHIARYEEQQQKALEKEKAEKERQQERDKERERERERDKERERERERAKEREKERAKEKEMERERERERAKERAKVQQDRNSVNGHGGSGVGKGNAQQAEPTGHSHQPAAKVGQSDATGGNLSASPQGVRADVQGSTNHPEDVAPGEPKGSENAKGGKGPDGQASAAEAGEGQPSKGSGESKSGHSAKVTPKGSHTDARVGKRADTTGSKGGSNAQPVTGSLATSSHAQSTAASPAAAAVTKNRWGRSVVRQVVGPSTPPNSTKKGKLTPKGRPLNKDEKTALAKREEEREAAAKYLEERHEFLTRVEATVTIQRIFYHMRARSEWRELKQVDRAQIRLTCTGPVHQCSAPSVLRTCVLNRIMPSTRVCCALHPPCFRGLCNGGGRRSRSSAPTVSTTVAK